MTDAEMLIKEYGAFLGMSSHTISQFYDRGVEELFNVDLTEELVKYRQNQYLRMIRRVWESTQTIAQMAESFLRIYSQTTYKVVVPPRLLQLYAERARKVPTASNNKLFLDIAELQSAKSHARLLEDVMNKHVDYHGMQRAYNKVTFMSEGRKSVATLRLPVVDVNAMEIIDSWRLSGPSDLAVTKSLAQLFVELIERTDNFPFVVFDLIFYGLHAECHACLMAAYFILSRESALPEDVAIGFAIICSWMYHDYLEDTYRIFTDMPVVNVHEVTRSKGKDTFLKVWQGCYFENVPFTVIGNIVPEAANAVGMSVKQTESSHGVVTNVDLNYQNEMLEVSQRKGISIFQLLDMLRAVAPDTYKTGSVVELVNGTWEAYKKANDYI